MMTVLVDVNVVLDVLLDRKPHAEASSAVWAAVETKVVGGLLAGHAVPTIHYLVQKELGAARARRIIATILEVFRIAPVNNRVIQDAVELPLVDFEDSVTASAARLAGCDWIVTRDPKGFRGSPVRHVTPEAAISLFSTF